ncbi:helix-turn-helix domain-containing protein [Microbacterium sp. MEC084]|uniref:IclR family transcriptional regulator n=1 Tax=Microbacterium sp. MEC084 TaxID=1963027 RepID=UPI00107063BF|nr:IclR family transcriptional regulator [Microbacterium sp. MEC084]MCD1269949.1 helix-turn-helix domain-containing protein [Microbacterium sp. MEC084]
MAKEGRTHGVDSARRVLQVLLQFTEKRPTWTVERLAQSVGTSSANTYRYLALLKELYLVEEHSRGVYTVSPRVFSLGRAASSSLDIASIARPALEELTAETGETSLLVRRVGDSVICIDSVEADQQVRLSFAPGALLPMHRGASAKVLLASLSPEKRNTYISRLAPELTSGRRTEFESELARINADGFAESSAEVDEDVWAVAAPVVSHGSVVAAISVAAPGFRVLDGQRDEIRDRVRAVAAIVSERMQPVLL